jgi:1,2-diacylglycerol 3-alpha-glucosyltransferase
VRIIIAGQTYYSAHNGQAIFSLRLAEGLVQAGHQVMMLVPSDRRRGHATWYHGIQVQALPSVQLRPWYPEVYLTFGTDQKIGRLFKEFRPGLVHLQDHYPLAHSVFRVAQRYGLPVMGTNHFLPENINHYLSTVSWIRPFFNYWLWSEVLSLYNRFDLVTTPTETGAAILRQQGLQPPVYAVSCGVDLKHFSAPPGLKWAEVRRRHGLALDRTVFLFVGRVDREKRLDVLLRALHDLGRDDLQLAIAGEGRHRPALERLAQELDLAGRVTFLGRVPDDELPALLNSADVFAMPSEAELQSIATLEAMAAGRPVLAAQARALPELVEPGGNGYLFRPGDPADAAHYLAELADHPERWPAMSAASLAKVQPHSLTQTICRYEELYNRLQTEARPAASPRRMVRLAARHMWE